MSMRGAAGEAAAVAAGLAAAAHPVAPGLPG